MKTIFAQQTTERNPRRGAGFHLMPRKRCAISQTRLAKLKSHTGALAIEFMARIECTAQAFRRMCAGMINQFLRWPEQPALTQIKN
jgi:hypothetical protein